MRNSQACYFESEEGTRKQGYVPVSLKQRVELCEKFDYTFVLELISGKKTNITAVVLDCQKQKEPLSELAELGGEFSSPAYTI